MRALRAFGRFWYDLVIGDDWKIAAAVTLALGVLVVLMWTTGWSDALLTVVGGSLLVVAFAVSLAVDTRRRHR
jgi:hypothetical protein